MNKQELYNALVDNGICTEAELQLLCDINGYSETTLLDALFARTGECEI